MRPPRHTVRGGHPITWTRIARASSPPSGWTSLAEAHEQRSAERLALHHLQLVPGGDPALGQVAEHVGVGVRDPRERPARAGLQGPKALGADLLDGQVPRRDRVAVRVVRGVAELGRDQLLELVGEDVLEHLGLLVDAIPRHAEALDQVQLEQPVMADDLERHAQAGVGEQHPVIAAMRDQAQLAQALDHPRCRRRGDAEPLGQRGRAHRLVVAHLQGVDRLGVVLDGGGAKSCGVRSGGHAKSKLWYA